MSDPRSNSPVESASSSLKFDVETREIKLEQKPGEQPVTIAGGSEGPETESVDGAENRAVPPESAA
jgi:hypothetical protein